MQEIATSPNQETKKFTISDFALEDKNRFVDVFAWLLKEDKKQNPANYQINNSKND